MPTTEKPYQAFADEHDGITYGGVMWTMPLAMQDNLAVHVAHVMEPDEQTALYLTVCDEPGPTYHAQDTAELAAQLRDSARQYESVALGVAEDWCGGRRRAQGPRARLPDAGRGARACRRAGDTGSAHRAGR
jgi:hypothetical protein